MAKYQGPSWSVINAVLIYEEYFKDQTLRHTREIKRNGNPAKSADEDVVEREIDATTENAINAAKRTHAAAYKEHLETQTAINIEPDHVNNRIERFDRTLRHNHNHHRTEYEDLTDEVRVTEEDIVAYRQEAGINREPILSYVPEVMKQASLFGIPESILGTMAAIAAGYPLFVAMLIGIASTVNNIGLGAYLLSHIVPYVFRKNSGKLWWLGLLASLLVALFVLTVNLNLMDLRKGGTDAGEAELVGLLFLAFNLFVWAFWFHKFFTAKDIYVEYGRLGEAREDAREGLRQPAKDCADAILSESEKLDQELEALREETAKAVTLSAQLAQKCDTESEQFELAQRSIVSVYQEVCEHMRTDMQGILGADTPAYFDTKPDYSYLIQTLPENTAAQDQLKIHEGLAEDLRQALRSERPRQHELVAAYQARIETEFGGDHV